MRCRFERHPGVSIVIDRQVLEAFGPMYVYHGKPYIGGRYAQTIVRDAANRRWWHELPSRLGSDDADGLGRMLRAILRDLDEAVSQGDDLRAMP